VPDCGFRKENFFVAIIGYTGWTIEKILLTILQLVIDIDGVFVWTNEGVFQNYKFCQLMNEIKFFCVLSTAKYADSASITIT